MLPLIIAAIFEILEVVALAMTVDELLSLLEDLFEGYQKFASDTQKAKEEIKRIIDKLKEEIAGKVEEKEEVAVLIGLSTIDPQRKETRQASGRGAGSPVISAAIEQKVPFRRVITMVCDTANKLPLPTLRKKKGVTIAELPSAKKKALLALLRMTAEELAGADLDTLIVVRLRQLATSLLFEFIDSLLEWQSPMKAEVNFGPQKKYGPSGFSVGSATL